MTAQISHTLSHSFTLKFSLFVVGFVVWFFVCFYFFFTLRLFFLIIPLKHWRSIRKTSIIKKVFLMHFG